VLEQIAHHHATRRLVSLYADEKRTPVSTITLFDGVAVADFDGLPASASRWL
jgi:hypothetical protein